MTIVICFQVAIRTEGWVGWHTVPHLVHHNMADSLPGKLLNHQIDKAQFWLETLLQCGLQRYLRVNTFLTESLGRGLMMSA